MAMRPLVVMTGQGLALADNFNLTKFLLERVPVADSRFPGLHEGKSLDHVFSATRRQEPGGLDAVSQLAQFTREICIPAREGGEHKQHHRTVLNILRNVARYRVVLHLTANIDGIATRVAVKECAATWRPVEFYGEEIMVDDIRQDARETITRGFGLLHFPVHGEAGLVAVKGPIEWEGAKRLAQADLDLSNKYAKHYSTLAQGMGVQVSEIERLMEAPGLGYRLLSALLTGRPSHDDGIGNSLEPAHLLAIGYAAGNAPERVHYPFERRLCEVRQRRHPRRGARWRAVVYDPEPGKGEAAWYTANGVDVIAHRDGELGEIVGSVLESMLS